MVTGGPEERFAIAATRGHEFKKRFPIVPLGLLQENKRRRARQVSHKFAMRTPLRQLKQTGFCWHFINWR